MKNHQTGPKTEIGKAQSSMNALKHGLTSRCTVLPGEDREIFNSWLTGLCADKQPVGTLEIEFVNGIASALWRLDRARNMEACLWIHVFGPVTNPSAKREFEQLMRYIGTIERDLHRSTIRLTQLQETRRKRDEARRKALAAEERQKVIDAKRLLQLQILEERHEALASKRLKAGRHFVSSCGQIASAPPSNQPEMSPEAAA